MKTIKELEKRGFYGVDANLKISLFEYGLACCEQTTNDCTPELLFYYGTKQDQDGNFTRFDWSIMAINTDIQSDYDWVDFDKIYSFTGLNAESWHALPLFNKISDLVSYYGQENVFGTSYDNGFEIKEN